MADPTRSTRLLPARRGSVTSPGDLMAEALAFLAEHQGLVRWHDDDQDGPLAWAMVRLSWSPEDRIASRIVMDDLDDPVAVALARAEQGQQLVDEDAPHDMLPDLALGPLRQIHGAAREREGPPEREVGPATWPYAKRDSHGHTAMLHAVSRQAISSEPSPSAV